MPDYSLNIHEDEAIKGNPKAKHTLIEFGDYECPYSRMGYRFVQRILKDHEEKLRFVFRHFPISKKHPHAEIVLKLLYLQVKKAFSGKCMICYSIITYL